MAPSLARTHGSVLDRLKSLSFVTASLLLSVSSVAHAQYALTTADWRSALEGKGYADFESVAIGDVDGDSRQDLVAVTAQHWVHIFRQLPNGTLAEVVKRSLVPTPCEPQDPPCPGSNFSWRDEITLADLTGDARPEIIVPYMRGIATLSVVPSRKQTVIRHRYDGDFDLVPYRVGAIDADGDGLRDLVAVDRNSGDMLIFYGDGAGGISDHERIAVGNMFGAGLEVGDVDGDGFEDIVYVERNASMPSQSRIHLLYGIAGGGFLLPQALDPNGIEEGGVVLADADDDGRTDLIHGPLVYRQLAPRSFADPTMDTAVAAYNLRSADLDGDGRRDLANVDWYTNAVRYQLGTGDGFGSLASAPFEFGYAYFGPVALAIGDLNDDGCGDVAVGAGYIGISWLLGSGCIPRPDLATHIGLSATAAVIRIDNLGAAPADPSSLEVAIVLNGGAVIKSVPDACDAIAGAPARFRCALGAMADGTYRALTFTLATSGVNAGNTIFASARVTTAQQEVRTTNNAASRLFRSTRSKAAKR